MRSLLDFRCVLARQAGAPAEVGKVRNQESWTTRATGHNVGTSPTERSVERRALPDRRAKPTTLRSVLTLRGRRSGFRRANEGRKAFVDCPSPKVIALVLWVMIGSALDALFTLVQTTEGLREANPVMALALAYDLNLFVTLKMATAASGSWILAALQQFMLASKGLYAVAFVYLGVMALHAMLILAGG